MNQKENLQAVGVLATIVSLVVGLLVSVGAAFLAGDNKEAVITPAQQAAITQNLVEKVNEVLGGWVRSGALSGPEIPSPFLQWGNVNHWATGNVGGSNVVATTTSNTFFTMLIPYGTTTLKSLTWRPDDVTGIGTTPTFDISTSTLVNGSSSPALIVAASISKAQVWAPAATTTTTNVGNVAFPLFDVSANGQGSGRVYTFVSTPSNPLYLTGRIASTTAGTEVIPSTFKGNLQAEFLQL